MHRATGKEKGRPSASAKLAERISTALANADAVLIPEPNSKTYIPISSRINAAINKRDERVQAEIKTQDWKDITGRDKFGLPERDKGEPEFTTFNFPPESQMVDAFFSIFSVELIQKVVGYLNNETEFFARNPSLPHNLNVAETLEFLAIVEVIQADYNKASPLDPLLGRIYVESDLRESVKNARKYLKEKSGVGCISIRLALRLIAHFAIPERLMDDFNEGLARVIHTLGVLNSGDEKFDYNTSDAEEVKKVKGKRCQLGIWHGELGCETEAMHSYIYHIWTNRSRKSLDKKVCPSDYVDKWTKVFEDLAGKGSLMICDSFYLDSYGLHFIKTRNIKGIFACQSNRLKNLVTRLNKKKLKTGRWVGLFNKKTNESFYKVKSSQGDKVKTKYIYAPGFSHNKRPKGEIVDPDRPIQWDAYKIGFGVTDRANHMNTAKDRKRWPFRHGGRASHGVEGAIFSFLLSMLIHNSIILWVDSNNSNLPEYSKAVLNLALATFQKAKSLNF